MKNKKEIELTVPSSLSEITLSKYQQFQLEVKDSTDEVFITTKMISIFCDIDESLVLSLNKNDYESISNTLVKILNQKSKFIQRFKMNGIEYGFIPNIDDMSFGEYIDLDTYIKTPADMHKVMSILYRPITIDVMNKYRIEDYTGREDGNVMLDTPMDVVNGSMVFFYHLGNELLNHIPLFLEQEVNKAIASNQISEENGAGIIVSTKLQMVNLESLMKQQNITYTKLLPF